MHDPGIDAESAQALQRAVKPLFLFARLASGDGIAENFRRCEMRHHAAQAQMFALGELLRETFHIGRRNAQAIHSRVNFQVERNRLPRAEACRSFVERLQLFAAVNHCGQVVVYQALLFAGNKTGENQHGLAHAGFAHGNAFFGAGDAEPVGAGFFKRLRYLRTPVAVAVALYDGQDFPWCFALFRWRINVVADTQGGYAAAPNPTLLLP